MSNKKILLVGNPNVGKSSLFNVLCGKKQKTANYTGVTVASLSGDYVYNSEAVEVTDLPGAYSIYPNSEDEQILARHLGEKIGEYTGIVYVMEALSLKRGLLLFQQVQDLGLPILLVINQIDQAEKRGLHIDLERLSAELGVKVLATNTKNQVGIEELRKSIYHNDFQVSKESSFEFPREYQSLIAEENSIERFKIWSKWALGEVSVTNDKGKTLIPKRLRTQEIVRRYQSIDEVIAKTLSKKTELKELLTEKLDKILVHPFWGYIIFGLLLLLIFNSVFTIAAYPQGWIEEGFSWLKDWISVYLAEGPVHSLVIDGILSGIEGIVVFAPQIAILFYFLYILEDSGYMARVVFLMDRFLRPFGLNGKSILPLVSGAACAVPAVMGARSIENTKERLLTILVTPFMTCSARLPIYSIIISLIIPDDYIAGISYKALALLAMYILGFLVALCSSFVLKFFMKTKEKSYLVMDLPSYKMPLWLNDLRLTMDRVWDFIYNAGRIIFAVSIILWALAYFGPKQNENEYIATDVEMKDSYLAIVGAGIEPVVEPLGYDWKMGVGIITSFAARELFVGTIGVLYGLDEDTDPESEEGEMKILDKMKADVKPNGEPVFSLATGVSLLLFYAFAMQCISTIAIVYRETKSLKWTMGQLIGMTGFAYLVAYLAYQFLK